LKNESSTVSFRFRSHKQNVNIHFGPDSQILRDKVVAFALRQ